MMTTTTIADNVIVIVRRPPDDQPTLIVDNKGMNGRFFKYKTIAQKVSVEICRFKRKTNTMT